MGGVELNMIHKAKSDEAKKRTAAILTLLSPRS